LRVLQQGEYTTVGGRTPIKTNVRIVAATNKDLRILIQQGLFREDLFFRLNVVPLRLPPLRERAEDVGDLARHFFAQAVAEGLPLKSLEPAALERLKRYKWPGNIRELENLVRRLAALYPQEVISEQIVASELGLEAGRDSAYPPMVGGPATLGPTARDSDESLSISVERHLAELFKSHGENLPPPGLYHRILREIEYPLISIALAATRGNQIKAAELLGLNRNTLRKKVRDLDVRLMRL
jgi:two-component system nitrogen regulation response regulator GlnG